MESIKIRKKGNKLRIMGKTKRKKATGKERGYSE